MSKGARVVEETAQNSHSWGWFVGGIALGSIVAAGGTLIALKIVRRANSALLEDHSDEYLSSLPQGKRGHGHRRNGSKIQRGQVVSRRSVGGGKMDGQVPPPHGLMRQDTEGYYDGHRESSFRNGSQDTTTHDDVNHSMFASPESREYSYVPERRNGNTSDLVSESEGGQNVGPPMYAGPADRSNPAVYDALRHTYTQKSIAVAHGPVKGRPGHNSDQPPPALPRPPSQQSMAQKHEGYGQSNTPKAAPKKQQYQSGAQTTQDVLATEGRIIEDAALHEHYNRVFTPELPQSEEYEDVCNMLKQALNERKKWVFAPRVAPQDMGVPEAQSMEECLGNDPFHWDNLGAVPYRFRMVDGVVQVWSLDNPEERLFAPPGDADDFFSTMHRLLKMSAMGQVRSFTHHRMQLLEQKFNLHVMLNADKEFLAQKSAPHRDFYNVRKVDTHVHHSACMHQKHLLRFIKSKLKKEPDELVIFRDGKFLTLKEVFESLNLTSHDLSVDSLDVHADKNIFHRFDKFNLKYNPFGQARLREIFIKQENIIRGRFLAELTKEVFVDLESSKYQHTEYRISIYGRKAVEWDTLAAWVVQNRLYSDNNLWMIQIPRLYNVYKGQGIIENFQQFLDNIFLPMFEATINPESHPMLHIFLKHVSGFDLVDDESKPERRPTKRMPIPEEWNIKHNPPYAYYTYYVYANLYTLNTLRESRGLNTFSLRPHCGEAGDLDHLAATFLLAENIAHGINLRKSPCLQYLYYVAQIGLCMSPLSNNSLFLDYHRNPFPQFFARGLSVSLSTDDPLQIHLTREPLVEEYSVAAQVWKLSATDLCEIARNSIIHSGFPHRLKMHWIHTEYWKDGPEGNNIQKTNVPSLRMVFRKDCLHEERQLLHQGHMAYLARQQHNAE
jgi:AMP deaminase